MAFVIVLKKHLGDLLKVVVDGLPGHRDHVVKQRHLLESFDSQNLEHDVHDDERLKKEKIGGDFDLFIELEIIVHGTLSLTRGSMERLSKIIQTLN